MRSIVFVAAAVMLAGCGDEHDWMDDQDPPVVRILSPADGAQVCGDAELQLGVQGEVDGVSYRCALDGGELAPCDATSTFAELGDGEHEVRVVAINGEGDQGQPVTIHVTVDRTGPALTAGELVIDDRGNATIALSADEDFEAGTAGVVLASPDGGEVVDAASCECSGASCACSELAPGVNRVRIAATDACGNAGEHDLDVTATYRPYRGHAVLVGLPYLAEEEEAPEPDRLLGNAVTLAPAAAPGDRAELRVLVWRPEGVPDGAVADAAGAIADSLAEDDLTASLTEFADPAALATLLRGRDVLVLHDPADAFDEEQLDGIATTWAPALASFTEAGGVVIALVRAYDTDKSQRGGLTWRLLRGGDAPLIDVTGATFAPSDWDFEDFSRISEAFPASAFKVDNYWLTRGIDGGFATPFGTACFELADTDASVVYDVYSGRCGDGCNYRVCPTVVDQVLPRYTIRAEIEHDDSLGYPECVPPVTTLAVDGTVTIDVAEGAAAPEGTLVCSYGAGAAYLQNPRPLQACAVTEVAPGRFELELEDSGRNGQHHVDLTLIRDGRAVRSTRVPFVADDQLEVVVQPVGINACSISYHVEERSPEVYNLCSDEELPVYQPFKAITCELQQQGDAGGWTTFDTKTDQACGALEAELGGFQSDVALVVDWGDVLQETMSGTLRTVFTAEDYAGNVVTRAVEWQVDGPFCIAPGGA